MTSPAPTVRVEPAGASLCLAVGETLMAAAERQGWRWPTVCHGEADCLLCWVEVIAGDANVLPAAPLEAEALERLKARRRGASANDPPVRLACQLRFLADAVVLRPGAAPPAA